MDRRKKTQLTPALFILIHINRSIPVDKYGMFCGNTITTLNTLLERTWEGHYSTFVFSFYLKNNIPEKLTKSAIPKWSQKSGRQCTKNQNDTYQEALRNPQ